MRREHRQGGLGQAAIGGDLAAEDADQRRLARRGVKLENIVPGRGLGGGSAIVVQGADARIGPSDLIRLNRRPEIFARAGAKIRNLLGRRLHLIGVAGVILLGRSDQGEFAFEGKRKEDAPVGILKDVAAIVGIKPGHDDMAAFDQTDGGGRFAT